MGLKGMEILLIMAVLLLLFGATRLPQLGSSLGSAIRNFKRGFSGDGEDAAGPATGEKQTGTLASSTTVEKDSATAAAPSRQS